MSPIDLLWLFPVAVVSMVAGLIFHELCHYTVGLIAGGNPFFGRYYLRIPTQVDFESPDKMSGPAIRVTGGIVTLWPLLAFSLMGYYVGSGALWLAPLILFFAGASGVSWLDLFALYEPKLWCRFTEGDSISRSDVQD